MSLPRLLPSLALVALAGCSEPQRRPAVEAGLCVRVDGDATRVVERGTPNLETCAARLELIRQQNGGGSLEGRYQTVRLYLDETRIDAAREDGAGPRFRVFEPADLTRLRAATRQRLEAEAAPRRTGPPVAEGLPPAPAR